MTTLISGIIAFLSLIVFFVSLVWPKSLHMAKVGDVFAHANPGISSKPGEEQKPFVSIYEIVKVEDGVAHKRIRTVWINDINRREPYFLEHVETSRALGLGKFDTQLKSGDGK